MENKNNNNRNCKLNRNGTIFDKSRKEKRDVIAAFSNIERESDDRVLTGNEGKLCICGQNVWRIK